MTGHRSVPRWWRYVDPGLRTSDNILMRKRAIRFFSGVIAILCLIYPGAFPVLAATSKATVAVLGPVRDTSIEDFVPRENEFAAAGVLDATTRTPLYTFKPNLQWPAASLTKLVTSVVFLNNRPSWNKTVTLRSADEVGGGRLRLPSGARMTVRDVFYSALVGSANNAAMAMARSTGYSLSGFVKKMNQKALALGLTHTHFVEPSGMDEKNISTALDMAKLARYAFSMPDIALAGRTKTYQFAVTHPATQKVIHNTNQLLMAGRNDMNILDGKTGFLYESMYNFIMAATPPSGASSKKLIVVVFGGPTTPASQESAARLANWAWGAYTWE